MCPMVCRKRHKNLSLRCKNYKLLPVQISDWLKKETWKCFLFIAFNFLTNFLNKQLHEPLIYCVLSIIARCIHRKKSHSSPTIIFKTYHCSHKNAQAESEGNLNKIAFRLNACSTREEVQDENADEFGENRFPQVV